MRRLALVVVLFSFAAPASAATPRFALLDLHDLVHASKNEFGDVKPSARRPHAAFVVRCAAGCRFGAGWLGFTEQVGPRRSDVSAAAAAARGRVAWSLRLTLSRRGRERWTALAQAAARRAKRSGVPDVLAVAVNGRILAAPFANETRLSGRVLELSGLTRTDARLIAKSF